MIRTKEQEATWAEKEAIALCLEAVALCQEIWAGIIRKETHTLARQLGLQEEAVADIQEEAAADLQGEVQGHPSHCKGYCRHCQQIGV